MTFRYFILAGSALLLSACGSGTVKDTLGLSRSAPDEYRVVSRPPLSMPPQFSIRPPSSSDTSPNQMTASQRAQSIVLGDADANGSLDADTAVVPVTTSDTQKSTSAGVSKADSQFLKNVGADQADPTVRDTLVEEKYTKQEEKENESWWDSLTFSDKKDPLVDAESEAERIRKNEDEGKPVTEGETPEVKAKDTGVLGHIFGY
jgi:hypothetical protein